MNDNNKYDVGVIVARFQVPFLTTAHRELINTVVSSHGKTLILLGVSPTLGTRENPLPYIVREKMIRQAYPNIHVAPIMDVPSNIVWSSMVDRTIQSLFPMSTICLYGGRDSFQKSYTGNFDTYEIFEKHNISGTMLREQVYNSSSLDSEEFREGVIYACYNQYPRAMTTIDVAIIKDDKVLMCKKVNDNGMQYNFVGGFADPLDEGLEQTAKREVLEETGLEVDELKYIGSYKINDWRYNNTTDRIITVFYKVKYTFGSPACNEELTSLDWISINDTDIEDIKEEHKILFKKLKESLK